MEEDLLLELAEGRRGLQAEFLTKDLPDPPVGAQGVGRAVNQAVVIATLGVFAFNYVFTQTLLATHPEIVNLR